LPLFLGGAIGEEGSLPAEPLDDVGGRVATDSCFALNEGCEFIT
jgi:hypothetical protein